MLLLLAFFLICAATLARARLGEKKAEKFEGFAMELYTEFPVSAPYVLAELGDPAQAMALLLDTGSPLLWARAIAESGCLEAAYSPSKSTRAEYLGRSAEFGYGSGVVSGPEFIDQFGLLPNGHSGVLPMGRVSVLAAQKDKGNGCQQGLLGMDMSSTSAQRMFETLAVDHVFSILLNRVPYLPGEGLLRAGSMTLGGADHSAYSGGMACVPMLPPERRVNASAADLNPQGVPLNNTAWWQLELEGVRVGHLEFGPGQGIVDTGTSELILSPAVMAHFQPLLTGSNCSDLPDITFTLKGGIEVSLGPEQYVQSAFVTLQASGCPVMMSSLPDAPSDDFFVFGDPFFWKYYVAFDYTRQQVGFGLKSGVPGTLLPQTCGAPLAK